jgi:Flp pilus assembly protein TadB
VIKIVNEVRAMIRHADGSMFQINLHEIDSPFLIKAFSVIAVIYLWLFGVIFYMSPYYIVGIVILAVSGFATLALVLYFCVAYRRHQRQREGEGQFENVTTL